MTTDEKKDFRCVVLLLLALSLVVLGSILVEFNIIDLFYLSILMVFMIRYIYIKLKPKPEKEHC